MLRATGIIHYTIAATAGIEPDNPGIHGNAYCIMQAPSGRQGQRERGCLMGHFRFSGRDFRETCGHVPDVYGSPV